MYIYISVVYIYIYLSRYFIEINHPKSIPVGDFPGCETGLGLVGLGVLAGAAEDLG